jgi:hypothetical protein
MVDSLDKKPTRVLLYGTRGRAIAAYSDGLGFYDETGIVGNDGRFPQTWLSKRYKRQKDYSEICIPVKVRMVIDE